MFCKFALNVFCILQSQTAYIFVKVNFTKMCFYLDYYEKSALSGGSSFNNLVVQIIESLNSLVTSGEPELL